MAIPITKDVRINPGVLAAGGVVDEVVVVSVDVPPICDQTKAPTTTTARIATHAIQPELRRATGAGVVRRSGRVSFEFGSYAMFLVLLFEPSMPIPVILFHQK